MKVKIIVSLEEKLLGFVVYDSDKPPFNIDRIMDGFSITGKRLLPTSVDYE